MNSELVDTASEIVRDPQILINLVSKRVKQLNSGRASFIKAPPSMGTADIALTEIIMGKVIPKGIEIFPLPEVVKMQADQAAKKEAAAAAAAAENDDEVEEIEADTAE